MPNAEFDPFWDLGVYLLIATALALATWAIYAWPGGDALDDRVSLRVNRVAFPAPVEAALRGVSHLGLFPVNGAIWLGLWVFMLLAAYASWSPTTELDLMPGLDTSDRIMSLRFGIAVSLLYFVGGICCFLLWLTCRIAKRRTNRRRPYETLADQGVVQRGMKPSGSSFPSSHSAMVWYTWPLLTLFEANVYPALASNLVFAIIAMTVALLVSYTRIYLGAHYLRDVLAGTVLGIGFLVAAGLAGGRLTLWAMAFYYNAF